jgi:zinc protease
MIHRGLIALAALLSPTGLQAQDAPLPKLPIEAYTLPNGLKVVLHRDPSIPRVVTCVAYHVGSKNESAGRTGFAHFFEHMMFRGTKNVPNYDIPLQEAGGDSNAFTNEDMTVYFETVSAPYLERALFLEAERLANLPSALDQTKFDTEREVVKNERRQRVDNVPYGVSDELLLENIFPKGHPYSWSVIGSMGDLDSATLDDLRQFFAEFYQPGNATLAVVGDFDISEARRLIDVYFRPLAPGRPTKPIEAPHAPTTSRRLEITDDVTLPRLEWAWPTVADDHPDAPALRILASVLSSGDASRLHRALILEHQVASEVDASQQSKEIAGLFSISATAAAGKAIEDVESALQATIDGIATKPITSAELDRALAQVETAAYNRLTSFLARAITLAIGYSQKNDPEYYRKDVERLRAVTTADLARVAKKYHSPEKFVLVFRPGPDSEPRSTAGPLPASEKPSAATTPAPALARVDWPRLPGPSAPRDFVAPSVVRRQLSNGVNVWFIRWPTLPLVTARLIVPAGTADDPVGKIGLANLTSTLATQGTTTRTATELTEALEMLGTSINAATDNNGTTLGFSVLTRSLEPTLALLNEVLTKPRFDPADFEREKKLLISEIERGPDEPQWIAQRAFRALLHGSEDPYGRPADGRIEDVKAITLDDVGAFHAQRYTSRNAHLVVAGSTDPDQLFQQLEKALGSWNTGVSARPDRITPPSDPAPRKYVYIANKPGAVQSVIRVGRRWVPRTDPSYFATLIGNRILGGDFLSRLNQNLRERNGFAYGAGSLFVYRPDDSVWAVNTNVRADATAPALREILSELDAPRAGGQRPFSAPEVAIARDAEILNWPEAFESPGAIAGMLSTFARLGLPPEQIETQLAGLKKTTAESIAAETSRLLDPAERLILIVGDAKSVKPALQAVGLSDVIIVNSDGVALP